MDIQSEFVVDYLEWDSCFFSKKIGLVRNSLLFVEHISSIYSFLQREQYDLIYVFSQTQFSDFFCKQYGGQLVDRKITYECKIQDVCYENKNVGEYNGDPVLLFDLAYQSGCVSRFKIDEHFSESDFKNLYETWVVESVSKNNADAVFVYRVDTIICGFITVKLDGHLAKIGLFAADKNWRRRGIGQALFRSVLAYCQKSGILYLQVVTQDANYQARAFYERQKMLVKEVINTYHFWL